MCNDPQTQNYQVEVRYTVNYRQLASTFQPDFNFQAKYGNYSLIKAQNVKSGGKFR